MRKENPLRSSHRENAYQTLLLHYSDLLLAATDRNYSIKGFADALISYQLGRGFGKYYGKKVASLLWLEKYVDKQDAQEVVTALTNLDVTTSLYELTIQLADYEMALIAASEQRIMWQMHLCNTD